MNEKRTRMFGWAKRMDRGLMPYMGPAALGAGHPEEPYRRPDNPPCPVCGRPMNDHVIERTANQTTATRLICPVR
jgi:hypothetical protein